MQSDYNASPRGEIVRFCCVVILKISPACIQSYAAQPSMGIYAKRIFD